MCEVASVSPDQAAELIGLGAVFISDVPEHGQLKPKWQRVAPPKSAASQQQTATQDCRHRVQAVSSTRPPWPAAGQPASTPVSAGQLLRIHVNPKRFPACHETDWPSCVLHCDADYLVINKPAGLPCQAHESNIVESVPACATAGLGLGHLFLLHRLDMWTTGVFVLGRSKEAARRYMMAMEAGEVRKHYKVQPHVHACCQGS